MVGIRRAHTKLLRGTAATTRDCGAHAHPRSTPPSASVPLDLVLSGVRTGESEQTRVAPPVADTAGGWVAVLERVGCGAREGTVTWRTRAHPRIDRIGVRQQSAVGVGGGIVGGGGDGLDERGVGAQTGAVRPAGDRRP